MAKYARNFSGFLGQRVCHVATATVAQRLTVRVAAVEISVHPLESE